MRNSRRHRQASDGRRQAFDRAADVSRLRPGREIGEAARDLEHAQRDDERGHATPDVTSPLTVPARDRPKRQAGRDPHRQMPVDEDSPSTAPQRPRTEPTDRSIPPEMITSVMPAATIASAGIRLARAAKVATLRKLSVRGPNSTTSPSQMASIAEYLGQSRRRQPHTPECRLGDGFLRPAGRRELCRDASMRHHRDAVAERHQLDQVARYHHDRLALRRQLAQQRMDRVLRRDVDAAGRLVEEQDATVAREPAGDHHLLLVAAAQLGHRLVDASASHRQPAHAALAVRDLGAAISQPRRARRRHRAECRVDPDRVRHQQPVALAVFGNEPIPALTASAGVPDAGGVRRRRELLAAVDSGPRRRWRAAFRSGPHPTAQRCRDLAAAHLETDVAHPRHRLALAHAQRDVACRPRRCTRRFAQIVPDHLPNELRRRRVPDVVRRDRRPSRITLIRSAMRRISSIRWLM